MVNNTEEQLRKTCKNLNWFCIKLNTHTITGHGNNQVSDFIVANNNGVYAIECKERKKYFNTSDLTQSIDMIKLINKSTKLIPYVLLNFYEIPSLFLIPYKEYVNIVNNNKFINGKQKKGLIPKDIPLEYKIDIFNNIKIKL